MFFFVDLIFSFRCHSISGGDHMMYAYELTSVAPEMFPAMYTMSDTLLHVMMLVLPHAT